MRSIISLIALAVIYTFMAQAASYKEPELRILMEKASAYSRALEYDSAMNVYSSVVKHYDPKMSVNDKRMCLDAIYGCFDINIKNGFYSAAVNDLALAENINEDLKCGLAKLHARYAQLYVVLLTQTCKEKYLKMIEEHAHEAFRLGIEEGDIASALTGYSNLLIVYYNLHDSKIIEKETNILRELDSSNWKIQSHLLDYEHMKASVEGDYDRAVTYIDSLINIIPDQTDTYRLRISTLRDKAIALGYGGHQPEAIKLLNEVIDMSYKHNLRDQRLGALNACVLFSKDIDDSKAVKEYNNWALALRDSLSAYNIGEEIVELEYVKERKELQQSIEHAKSHHKLMRFGLIGLSVIVITVIVFLIVLKRKNAILSYRAGLLRERMQELYSSNPRANRTDIGTHKAIPTEMVSDCEPSDEKENTISVKYESSSLTDDEKRRIADEIETATAGDIVFNPEFSLNMLAETVHRHPKVVSQVINEVFSVNFSTYINRIRIVEACRMFDNPQYANWSVEGIAEAVGIKSRSSFSSNFKKITGMNIKEYRKNVRHHDSGHI